MLHGDISNQAGITIGFRCDSTLVHFRENTLKDRFLNTLFGRAKRAEVDEVVRSIMEYLYRNTEYNVDLIVTNREYTADLKNLLDDMPFNRIVLIDKDSQISARLLTGDLSYYIDNDYARRSTINSRYAISISDLRSVVPIKTRRVN